MKIRPVGAELFHAGGRTDRRTDMTKLIVVCRNFANAPKTWLQRQIFFPLRTEMKCSLKQSSRALQQYNGFSEYTYRFLKF
jgi:hypothetical protein